MKAPKSCKTNTKLMCVLFLLLICLHHFNDQTQPGTLRGWKKTSFPSPPNRTDYLPTASQHTYHLGACQVKARLSEGLHTKAGRNFPQKNNKVRLFSMLAREQEFA